MQGERHIALKIYIYIDVYGCVECLACLDKLCADRGMVVAAFIKISLLGFIYDFVLL